MSMVWRVSMFVLVFLRAAAPLATPGEELIEATDDWTGSPQPVSLADEGA